MSGKPKLSDVARVAGVSPATVSRVLNNPKIVRPSMQAKVRHAIATLGFTPSAAARALKSRKSRTIGAVVPALGVAIFADGISALQSRLREAGFTLLVANSEYDPAKELQEIRVLVDRGVDGVVLVGDAFSRKAVALAKERNVPLVTTYVCESRRGVPAIGVDNAEAMSRMVRHLLGLGHREFGVITDAATRNDRTMARRSGVARALVEAGLELTSDRIVKVSYSVSNGRSGLRTLLEAHPDITAVVCTSDALAIGALSESKALGFNVPRDLSITGYDDIDVAAHTDPPLTTVKVPASEIGRSAADHLIALIDGDDAASAGIELPAPVVVRGSTGPVRVARGGGGRTPGRPDRSRGSSRAAGVDGRRARKPPAGGSAAV